MLELVSGDRQLSSWSFRAWLLLKHSGLEFAETRLRLDTPGFVAAIRRYSPALRVPVLIDGPLHVWDTLAISEYVNERVGGALLPRDRGQRAWSRSISAEMHAGFADLRNQWPMLAASTGLEVALDTHGARDLARIDAIWSERMSGRVGAGGWLFGDFSIADAMYAPVVLRFRTYGAVLSPAAQAYASFVANDAFVREWIVGAASEIEPRTDG